VEYPLVDAFVTAWDNHSADALRATMSEDAIYEVVPQGRSFGPDKLGEQVGFMQSLSSDFSMSIESVLRDGNRYAVEWALMGTNDGPFGPLHLEASGRSFRVRGAWIIETENSKITLCRAYWDFAGLLRQIDASHGGQVAWQMALWSEEHSSGMPTTEEN